VKGHALDTLAVSALGLAIAVAVAGPFQFALFGRVFHARTVAGPLIAGLAAWLVRLAIAWRSASVDRKLRAVVDAAFRITVLTLLASDAALVLGHLVLSCGGLDSAGYLGAAQLFLTGRLTDAVPIARVLPFADPTAAATPLGFVPAAAAFHIAPRFPPGLPLVMAAALALGGRLAPFFVAPVFGFGAVALVGMMARERMGATAAALSAVMLASSPVFVDMALQPMSDVPAMFWIVFGAFLAWRPSPSPIAAGAAAGMAILTRPPLALAALSLVLVTRWRGWRQAAAFTGVMAIFVAAVLVVQWRMYGDPLRSGYGSGGQLFTAASLWPNLAIHATWLLTVHTPLLVVLFAAGTFFDRQFAWRAGAMFLSTAFPYLVYAPRFEDWEVLRFLLPGLPFLFIVCAGGVIQLAGRSHEMRARLVAMGVAAAATAGSYVFVSQQHVFALREQERKYSLVGEWFASHAPARAVAIASLHSGSLRYYSGRAILRMEALPERRLYETVRALQDAGYAPFTVLEVGDEFEEYQRRFQPDRIAGLISDPVIRIRGVDIFQLRVR
jgi:hypothetical protein